MKLKRPCSACNKLLFVDDVELIGKSYMGNKLTFWFNCNKCKSTMISYDKQDQSVLERAEKGSNYRDLTKRRERNLAEV